MMSLTIKPDVATVSIPFLLSKGSMKATRTIIDFTANKLTMLDQTIPLIFTSSSYDAVPIA